MAKGAMIIVLAISLTASCSERQDVVIEGSEQPHERLIEKRSFDPELSDPQKPISALEVVKGSGSGSTKVEVKGDRAPAPVGSVKGRESGLARDILDMPDGDTKNLAMAQLFSQWAISNIGEAMEVGESITDDLPMKRAFYTGVAPYLSEHQPERLLDIISAGNWWNGQWLPERAALQRVASTDFERAKEFFEATGPNKQHPEEAYRFTRQIAASESVEAALRYSELIEGSRGRAGATRAAVAAWVNEDSLAASQFTLDTTEPQIRDGAILGLADGLLQSNPDDTLAWVQSLSDTELRNATFTRLATSWQSEGQAQIIDSLLAIPDLTSADRRAIEVALSENARPQTPSL